MPSEGAGQDERAPCDAAGGGALGGREKPPRPDTTTPPAGSPSTPAVHSSNASRATPGGTRTFVSDAYAKVPEIGKGRRWYDTPYRFLNWLLSSRGGKAIPPKMRTWLGYGVNYLLRFHQHDLNKARSRDDPLNNLLLSEQEHVFIPAVWVVELFPPSEFAALSRAMARNGWDEKRVRYGIGEANLEMLEQARSNSGWNWWQLGVVVRAGEKRLIPDAVEASLPAEFDVAEFIALQIGSGLTAVIAQFQLTDDAARTVDQVWHEVHEPRLVWRARWPTAEDRLWVAYRKTQETRKRIHDAARSWMAHRCGGFFASAREPQPVFDMLLLDQYDPVADGETNMSDPLRALGLTRHTLLHTTAAELPGLLLSQVDPALCRVFRGSTSTWALWGNGSLAASAAGDLEAYGSDRNRALSYLAHDRARSAFVLLAMSEFLRVFEERYAGIRDSARARHGRFRVADLKLLRADFLTSSLDLASLKYDIDSFFERGWRYVTDAQFATSYAPSITATDSAAGRIPREPVDLQQDLQERQSKQLDRLSATDRAYREILSTVAGLGTSIGTIRVGRIAVLIGLASLAVAVIALLAAS